jgi:hypothetical protein
MKRILYGLLAVLYHACAAQDASSLGNTTSTCNFNLNTHDVWASTCNPAGINEIKKISFGAFFQNHFFLKDVSSQYASLVLPFNKSLVLAANLFHFGNTLFSKNELGALASLKLNAKINVGAQLHLQFIHQSEEKEKYIVFPDLGITYNINERFTLASSLKNFASKNDEKSILRLGLSYLFDKKVQTHIQCVFSNEKYPTIAAAIDYKINENLIFKLNISNSIQPFHFGLAYQVKSMRICVDFGYHQQLGFSPSSSLSL